MLETPLPTFRSCCLPLHERAIAGDLRGRLENLVWCAGDFRTLKGWVPLSYPERQTLTRWLERDIQEDGRARHT
jgi:hypothetical protein